MTLNKQKDIHRYATPRPFYIRGLCAGGYWYMQRWRGILAATACLLRGSKNEEKLYTITIVFKKYQNLLC